MEDKVDYFEHVKDHQSVINHLNNLVHNNSPLFFDTNIVPTLEHYLKRKESDLSLVPSYIDFMRCFNQWLGHEKLVLVPGVRQELTDRLGAAGYYTRESWKRNDNSLLPIYEKLVDEALAKIETLPPFSEPLGYSLLLEVLVELHQYMNWQKLEHESGNADDQIVAASLVYGLNEDTDVTILSNDQALTHTLVSYHKFLSSQQILGNSDSFLASKLRHLNIRVRSFNPQSGQIDFRASTDFRPPYFYRFWEDMKIIGRPGFREASRNYQNAQKRIISRAKEALQKYMNLLQSTEKKKLSKELDQSLEHLSSLINFQPSSWEELSLAEKSYQALLLLADKSGAHSFLPDLKQKEQLLKEKRRDLLNQEIEKAKVKLKEACSQIKDENDLQSIEEITTQLKDFYQRLKE